MPDKDTLHIRVSKELVDGMGHLVSIGLFSNKNEIVRGVIRNIILKYKDEIEIKK